MSPWYSRVYQMFLAQFIPLRPKGLTIRLGTKVKVDGRSCSLGSFEKKKNPSKFGVYLHRYVFK